MQLLGAHGRHPTAPTVQAQRRTRPSARAQRRTGVVRADMSITCLPNGHRCVRRGQPGRVGAAGGADRAGAHDCARPHRTSSTSSSPRTSASAPNWPGARVAYADDAPMISRLTLLVADAHGVLYGQRDTEVRRSIRDLALLRFPAAVYRIRWFILAAALLTFIPWAVFQIWLAVSPKALDVSVPGSGARPVHPPRLRGVLLVPAGAELRHPGVPQQHPRRLPGLRLGRVRLRHLRRAADLQRCQRRHGRRRCSPASARAASSGD